MIVGGMPYSLAEVGAAAPIERVLTGIQGLDEHTGGIGRGELWAIEGMSGTGVTAMCNSIGAGASTAHEIALCNGHVPSRVLCEVLNELAATERLSMASWLPSPEIDAPPSAPNRPRPALAIYDTWDEVVTQELTDINYTGIVERFRRIRRVAAETDMAVVLGIRLPRAPREDPIGWLAEAVAEAAHVRIELKAEGCDLQAIVRVRGASDVDVPLRRHGSRVRGLAHRID